MRKSCRLFLNLATSVAFVMCLLQAMNCAAAPRPRPHAVVTASSLTLLNEVGKLNRAVSNAEIAGWKRQLHGGRLSRQKAALLHLRLGEVEIARNKEPERALEQFRLAQILAGHANPVYGRAAYDRAMTLFFEGAFDLATPAFHELLRPGHRLSGYPITCAALWYRHAGACAGYHAKHAKLGITEPPRLDPLCGVASLAACLRANNRPYDRKTLLTHCRMTGLGNGMQDLLVGAKRLGMSARVVKADTEGLKALPMPVVAYVELDHFVAVTRADAQGVSYLCSDCGSWPGGRRDLTWKQWRAMDCNLYLVVTRPGSLQDDAMSLLTPGPTPMHLAAAATRGPSLIGYRLSAAEAQRALLIHLIGRHVLLPVGACNLQCGQQVTACQCTDGTCCLTDGGGPPNGSPSGGTPPSSSPPPDGGAPPPDDGPSSGEPVDLATGEEHYRPEADLTVYNPIGPNVVWRRRYGSMRGPFNAGGLFPYAQYAFGNGWNSEYDYQAVLYNGVVNFYEPGGGAYAFTVPTTPTAANPQVSCPANSPGTPMLCNYAYNNDGSLSFIFTKPDRSQWSFSSLVGYALARIMDRNSNFINFVYTTPGSGGYALAAITDSNNRPLLTIRRNAHFNIVSVADRYSRSVVYQVKRYGNIGVDDGPSFSDELVQVSQIVRTGSVNPPYRYLYGYAYNTNGDTSELLPVLHTITVPSPTGRGNSTATINYAGVYVASLVDANGNTRTYTAIDGNDAQVTVTDSKNNTVTSYTVGFDAQMRTTYRTDGTNSTQLSQESYLPDNAYQPASVTDGNNETTAYTYDQFGQVTSMTSPRNVTTTYTFDYSVFPLGELKQVQEGSKTPTSFACYEPSGLPKTVTVPMPGTSSSVQTVTVAYSYDSLGNVLALLSPGNDTTSTITTTLNYTKDGAFTQADAIGQPLTITDNLGHVTHLRYDAQGNRVVRIDALGNETDFAYNLANQQTRMFAPAIGDITNLLSVTRSALKYSATTKTYDGTLTLANVGSQGLQGSLLIALTNPAPGVTLANATGNYVNSPCRLTPTVNLAPGAKTVVNVSFAAPSAKVVSYGVQTYLTDSMGNPAVLSSETRNVYLYPGGPLNSVNLYDEARALYRQIRYGLGREGELLSVSGSTEPVTYAYDAAYRQVMLVDGNRSITRYAYNTAGWLASVTYPKGDGEQYPAYDPMGHVLKRIDGRGIETDYVYNDPESLLTNVQYVNGASYPNVSQYNVSVDYDGYGRQQDVYDVSGRMHYDYDDLDTQNEIDTTYLDANGHPLPTVALSYAFNPDGSRRAMNLQTTTTDYTFSYSYDGTGRPLSLTNPFSEVTQWSYLDNNWIAAQQNANGVVCLYAYNRRGLLNDLTNYAPNSSLLSDFGAIVYDAAGNPMTKAVTIPGAPAAYSGRATYAYDIRDQLIHEQSTLLGGYTEIFHEDPAGNPLTFKGKSNSFNADNQCASTGFAYDGAGNPTTYAGTALTFDPENDMTAVGTTLTAAYRGDGLRAWKQTSSGRTYFLYDDIDPVLEMDATGNVAAINTFGPFDLISRHTSAESVIYTFDMQGSRSQSLDSSGNSLSTSAFDGFGSASSTTVSADPFGYGAQWGYYTDAETGISLLAHRYYDSGMGRFLTRDPAQYDGGINLYAYVTNGPIGQIDALGLDPTPLQRCHMKCALGGGVVGGVVSAILGGILGSISNSLTKEGCNQGCDNWWKKTHPDPVPPSPAPPVNACPPLPPPRVIPVFIFVNPIVVHGHIPKKSKY